MWLFCLALATSSEVYRLKEDSGKYFILSKLVVHRTFAKKIFFNSTVKILFFFPQGLTHFQKWEYYLGVKGNILLGIK